MTLPGLGHFLMAGQWVMPGGGLPSGLMLRAPPFSKSVSRMGYRFWPDMPSLQAPGFPDRRKSIRPRAEFAALLP